jgi:phage/plasmid-like protein (TIGR03299 family)
MRKLIMSHELEIVKGKAQMAYTGETPWHGLGKKVPADLTPGQMLKAAGLDWEVMKYKASARPTINGKAITYPSNHSVLVRSSDGKYLGDITNDWNTIQNDVAFSVFDDIIKTAKGNMETAGALYGGKIVWGLARLNEEFEAVKGDTVESFLLFTNPHVYGKKADCRFTPIRVVCRNTMVMALNQNSRSNQMWSINHRSKFNPEEVKEMLGIAHDHLSAYKEASRLLAAKRFTDDKLNEYFNFVFPKTSTPKKETKKDDKKELSVQAKRSLEIMDTQPGAKFAQGTWWQAFNATTYIMDHEMGNTQDGRVFNSWYGGNRTRKIDAMDKALELAA